MSDMTLSEELEWRGFVNQATLKDLKKLDTKKRTFYHGFDASAESQTVGNLAAMMFDKCFIRHGYKAVLLAGGSTSLVGDPGGKNEERQLQDEATIAHNVTQAEKQIKQVMAGEKFTLVNNLDWTKDVKVLPFLRDIGKHFSMTTLIHRDYIAKRLGKDGAGMSYAEFSYTILQGYDYLHLFDKYEVTLQLGGSDQWGNCLSGVDLIRKVRNAEVDALTLNLVVNKATGEKFGKSESGSIWLDASKTSVYQFYQFWLNVDDESVADYLKIFTELDRGEVDHMLNDFNKHKDSRLAQKTLAYEVTKLVHGEKRADSVRRITGTLFAESDFADLDHQEIDMLKAELPVVKASQADGLARVIVSTGLANSNTEALRFVASGAISVNGNKVDSSEEYPFHRGSNLLKRGKNSFAIVEYK